jgi:hypothetical protein
LHILDILIKASTRAAAGIHHLLFAGGGNAFPEGGNCRMATNWAIFLIKCLNLSAPSLLIENIKYRKLLPLEQLKILTIETTAAKVLVRATVGWPPFLKRGRISCRTFAQKKPGSGEG